ncbi:hypothetical protein [Salegentibacter mishustinae]|uniref:Uncharacterized protein n=1 Tax=Salegentibacter mishustinae TaxID=270918 RepID=A0A0Q9ZFV4_9FLAO|nr:hypothetical protein [Salegentibacter mishustinae]KRG28238.1 hypothetical protein APR42_05475 [Salegentibacter mishustinae]PNW22173.1 hypothetical protein APB85_13240 [Salegentibacter mishustinae]PZX67390.1 hypothetical protein LY54_00120 [Salegentibacter mishustinae]GGW80084.1 hypothetical protein GCM10008086_04850 [Salegentibacter mishustinae]
MEAIPFFSGLSKTQSFEKLSEFTIKEALLACVLSDFDPDSFIIENHDNRCLTFNNEKYLFFILIEEDHEILAEIKEAMETIKHLHTAIIQIELDLDLSDYKRYYRLSINNIINGGIQREIPEKNLFFTLLKDLYGKN